MSRKTLTIGLNGATFCLFKPWSEMGYLPNFGRLLQGRRYSNWGSTLDRRPGTDEQAVRERLRALGYWA